MVTATIFKYFPTGSGAEWRAAVDRSSFFLLTVWCGQVRACADPGPTMKQLDDVR